MSLKHIQQSWARDILSIATTTTRQRIKAFETCNTTPSMSKRSCRNVNNDMVTINCSPALKHGRVVATVVGSAHLCYSVSLAAYKIKFSVEDSVFSPGLLPACFLYGLLEKTSIPGLGTRYNCRDKVTMFQGKQTVFRDITRNVAG